mgnify:FL=1
MKAIRLFVLITVLLCTIFSFNSCSRLMGYSVVLWSLPEQNLTDGMIVPVYIKSNITQSYVIGIPETDKKCEVPLWQISEPCSKKDVNILSEKYAEYQRKYAKVKLDGLPIRHEPVNTARQVYRLRESEIIRVLYKGEGSAVMAGKSALQGDWLRVLTNDGTIGWCFSYNLNVFDERDEQKDSSSDSDAFVIDEYLTKILTATWYPESYADMIRTGRIDLGAMSPYYKFDTGFVSGEVSININGLKEKASYKGLSKVGSNVYQFDDTGFKMTVRSSSFIVVQYIDELGMPSSFNFVTLSTDINEVIAKEQERRKSIFDKIVSAGPSFSSSNYGTIEFTEDFGFAWTGYSLLTPSLIPENSGVTGSVALGYFLGESLKEEFDGVLTLTFDENARKINFFYKLENDGLRLEDAQRAQFKKSLAVDRSSNPVVMYFAK